MEVLAKELNGEAGNGCCGRAQVRRMTSVTRFGLGVVVAMVALEPSVALAASSDPWTTVVQQITNMLIGPLGKGAAIIAVVALGFMAMAGKLAWDTAIKVVVGIVLVFSSVTIVDWVQSGAGDGTVSLTATTGSGTAASTGGGGAP